MDKTQLSRIDPFKIDLVLFEGLKRLVLGMGIYVSGLPKRCDSGHPLTLFLRQASFQIV